MRELVVTLAREAALDVLAALDRAITLAVDHGWTVEQVRFEDAYRILRDALFPSLPDA